MTELTKEEIREEAYKFLRRNPVWNYQSFEKLKEFFMRHDAAPTWKKLVDIKGKDKMGQKLSKSN